MNCEHVFQIAVSVDDESIKNSVIDNATKTLTNDIMSCYMVKRSYNSYNKQYEPTQALTDLVDKHVTAFIEQHKGYILDMVVNQITEKITRSKAYREMVEDVTSK